MPTTARDARPRVLYLLPAEGFGGAERQGVLHIRHLPDHGVDIVAVVGPGKPVREQLDREGCGDYLVCDDFPSRTHAPMSLAKNLAYGVRYVDRIRRSIRFVQRIADQQRIDAVLANRTFAWPVGGAVAQRAKVPYLIRAGSRITHDALKVGATMLRWRYGPPALLMSNCHAVQRDFTPLFRCPARVVPNGIDTERFSPERAPNDMRAKLELSSPAVTIGLAARPAPEKGLDLLAEVVARVSRQRPSARLLIAGEFGWRAHYEQLFARHGLAGRVRFLGHVAQIERFFAACDLVILCSRRRSIEGLPNALMEAMAMERPVVSTDVGGVTDLVDDTVEGFVVPPEQVEPLAERIVELIDDPDLRRRMGRAGRQRIVRQFDNAHVVAQLADAIRGVLRAHR